MSQAIQTWTLKVKQVIIPKLISLFQKHKPFVISFGILSGSITLYWIFSKVFRSPSSPKSKKGQNHLPMGYPGANQRTNLQSYPRTITINPNIYANMKKRQVNLEDLSTPSQSDQGTWNDIGPTGNGNTNDWYGHHYEFSPPVQRRDEREINKTKKEASEDPDDLFFNIFQKVNASLK